MIVIGIDIGLSGAAAAIDHNGRAQVADLAITESSAGNRLHGRGLLDMLRSFAPVGEPALVVIEDVRPRAFGNGGAARTNSMHSQASMMGSRRTVEAVCDIAGLKVMTVQPQAWKRHFALLGKDKDESRQVALRLMPSAAAALGRKMDHNRAEALLIAKYGLSEFT